MACTFHLSETEYTRMLGHLLSAKSRDEQAAFVFAHGVVEGGDLLFQFLEWSPVNQDRFVYRSPYYLELADVERGRVIKRAHDLGCSLIELHSHPFSGPAVFSESDLAGLSEFVPHVRWRLKDRPYLAVVVAPGSFDALLWAKGSRQPEYFDGLVVDNRLLPPTGLSLQNWDPNHGQ